MTAFSWKRGQNNTTDDTLQAVISLIPPEDLEKSPAPILPYNHIPRAPMFEKKVPAVLDSPDYYTVPNFDEFYSAMDEYIWSADVPETPPPCYAQALEMTLLTAVAVELEKEVQSEDFAV